MFWEKEKMMATSLFFFFYHVFKSLFSHGRQPSELCGKELMRPYKTVISDATIVDQDQLAKRPHSDLHYSEKQIF